MTKKTKYRRAWRKQMKVLVNEAWMRSVSYLPEPGWHVLEGLAKPKKGAYWKFVQSVKTEFEAKKIAAGIPPALGFVILKPDAEDILYISPDGDTLSKEKE